MEGNNDNNLELSTARHWLKDPARWEDLLLLMVEQAWLRNTVIDGKPLWRQLRTLMLDGLAAHKYWPCKFTFPQVVEHLSAIGEHPLMAEELLLVADQALSSFEKNWQMALALLEIILQQQPQHPAALRLRATTLAHAYWSKQEGTFEQALELLDEALAIQQHPTLFDHKLSLLSEQGCRRECIATCEEFAQAYPQVRQRMNLLIGTEYLWMGEYATAKTLLLGVLLTASSRKLGRIEFLLSQIPEPNTPAPEPTLQSNGDAL